MYALSPDNGTLVWANLLGPNSDEGGYEWGSSSDGRQLYVANSNAGSVLTDLVNPVVPVENLTGANGTSNNVTSRGGSGRAAGYANATTAATAITNSSSTGSSSSSGHKLLLNPNTGSAGGQQSSSAPTPTSKTQPGTGGGNTFGCATAGQTFNGGFIAALDLQSGQVVWSFGNPLFARNSSSECLVFAKFLGPVSAANGVVYAPSMDPNGSLFFLDAVSGRQLGAFATGASLNGGASIVGDMVFIGSGYNKSAVFGTPGSFAWGLRLPAA